MTGEFQRALDFIERADGITSIEELKRALSATLQLFGVPHFSVCAMLRDAAGDGGPQFTVLISGTPRQWSDYYRQQKCFNVDVAIHEALQHANAFAWSEVEGRRLSKRGAKLFDEVREAMPILGGYVIPVHTGAGFAGVVALYCEDHELTPKSAKALRLIGLYALEKAQALLPMARTGGGVATLCPLSQRQREILSYAALGKSETDTGAVLGLSSFTVREHLIQVRRKLNVRTKLQAVALAVHRGWVVP